MERRSARIQDSREKATERQFHEEEERVAPQPRSRQNQGNREHHNRRHGHEQPQEDNILIIEGVHEEGEQEVGQNVGNDPVQGEEPPPPPPTLVEVMDRQTLVLENLARR